MTTTIRRRAGIAVAAAVIAITAITLYAAHTPATPKLDPAAAAAADDQLQQLSLTIGGTLRQRRAGEIVQYRLVQDQITACMAKAGWDYTPPAFIDMYAGKTSELVMGTGAGRWLAPINAQSLGIAEQHQRLAKFDQDGTANPGYAKLSPADQDRYAASLTGCAPRVAVDVNFPASSHRLNDTFLSMLDNLEKTPQVTDVAAGYEPCMRAAGVPARDYEDLIAQIQETVGQAAPGNDKPTGPDWQAALAREHAAAAADARCRSAVRDTALTLAGPAADQFARDHATELKQVQADWEALVTRALQYPEGKTYLS